MSVKSASNTVYECDRCKVEYVSGGYHLEMPQTVGAPVSSHFPDRRFDICQGCLIDLAKWFAVKGTKATSLHLVGGY